MLVIEIVYQHVWKKICIFVEKNGHVTCDVIKLMSFVYITNTRVVDQFGWMMMTGLVRGFQNIFIFGPPTSMTSGGGGFRGISDTMILTGNFTILGTTHRLAYQLVRLFRGEHPLFVTG